MFLIATVEFLLLLAQLEIIGPVGQRGSFQVVASTRQCYSWGHASGINWRPALIVNFRREALIFTVNVTATSIETDLKRPSPGKQSIW
jgi:hypothetical protein